MRLTPLGAGALLALLAGSGAGRREGDTEKCIACYGLAEQVAKRMTDTEARASEKISIGVRLGHDGSDRPKAVVPYGDSERRFLDVTEGACEHHPKKSQCNLILHEADDTIAKWFYTDRQHDFAKYVCDARIPGCSAEVVARAKASRAQDVEVEDERDLGRTADAPKAQPSSPSAADAKVHSASKDDARSAEKTPPAFDAIALVQKILARMRNNANRARHLSVELGGELAAIARTKNWTKLAAMAKDPAFYQKYWIVFASAFMICYAIYSLLEALFFSKPAAPKPERRPAGSKRKVATTAGTSASGKTGSKKSD